ncbi:hypothetical protein DZD52_11455 [Xanthomonas nasturtii]|uniref:Uncharacterized protein n=1 Tax=Xanthomonas nasturtii TaxID=1843581 RepID=A0A3E1KJD5_9XANT|nr:hypothetical protein DZD52_11455 [Xanthomonas nasturtii]
MTPAHPHRQHVVIAKRAAGLDVCMGGVSGRMCAQWGLAGARGNGVQLETSTRGELACRGTCSRRHAHLAGGDTISPAGNSAVDIARIVPAPDPVV